MFKTLNYQYYVFISLSVAVLLILLATNLVFYFYTESIITKNVVENKLQTTQKIQEQLDAMLNEMNNVSISVNASNVIQQVLRSIPENGPDNYFDKNPQIGREVRDVLYSITGLQPLKGSIVILSRNLDYIDLSNNMDSPMDSKEEIAALPGIQALLQSNRIGVDHVILAPHPDRWSESGGQVISLIRPIRDNFNVYGLIEISYGIQQINDLFEFHNLNGQRYVIFGANNSPLLNRLGADSGIAPEQLLRERMFGAPIGNFEIKGKDKTFMATYAKLAAEDWTVVMLEDLSIYRRPVVILRNTTLSIYLIMVCVTLLILYLYTLGITRPITRLKKSLSDMDAGNPKLFLYSSNTNNEIVLLGKAFQNLLGEIRRHMEMTEQAHRNEMRANMSALQAQINPHFLYNTLAVISAQGLRQGNRDVVDMCTALSNMFRYVTKKEDRNAFIGTEIEHIRNYLMLMSKRYEGFFQYEIDIDPAMEIVPLPKLALQPFVENMFQHAFSRIKPPWFIWITGRMNGGDWTLEFRDNGAGFPPEAIAEIRRKLDDFKQNGAADGMVPGDGSIGITNSLIRLYLADPGHASAEFLGGPDGGATVRIGGKYGHVQTGLDRR